MPIGGSHGANRERDHYMSRFYIYARDRACPRKLEKRPRFARRSRGGHGARGFYDRAHGRADFN